MNLKGARRRRGRILFLNSFTREQKKTVKFDPECDGDVLLWNVGLFLPNYMALYPRREKSVVVRTTAPNLESGTSEYKGDVSARPKCSACSRTAKGYTFEIAE
jgi:hypothetical protein